MLLFVTWCDSGQFNLGITYMQMQETEQFSTNRIPSHTGKRELAPQLPGNTLEQDKRYVGSGTLTFSDIHYGPATIAFFQILPDLPGVGRGSGCIGAMCVGRSFELTAGSPKPRQTAPNCVLLGGSVGTTFQYFSDWKSKR